VSGGHGGKRAGAGRKRKLPIAPIDLAEALGKPAPAEIEPVAQQHARDALHALVAQLKFGTADAASIAAANTILDRAYGKPAIDLGGTGTLPFLGRAPTRSISNEIRDEARQFAHLAITRLRQITLTGLAESARVAAARSLLERGLGVAAAAKVDDDCRQVGRREQAQRDANAPADADSIWGDDLNPRLH
jgi:hypothetical protein